MEPQGAADLCRRIAEDAAAQAAELLRLAAEKASARIAQAEAEAARLREEAVLRGRAAAAQEETRLLAKVRLDARRNELAERERLIEEVMGRVRRRIAGLRLEPGYAGVLKRLAAEAVLELGEREAEILLPPGDRERLDGAALREIAEALAREGIADASVAVAAEPAPCVGAVARSRTGRVSVDNTLEAKIFRNGREIRLLVSKALFG